MRLDQRSKRLPFETFEIDSSLLRYWHDKWTSNRRSLISPKLLLQIFCIFKIRQVVICFFRAPFIFIALTKVLFCLWMIFNVTHVILSCLSKIRGILSRNLLHVSVWSAQTSQYFPVGSWIFPTVAKRSPFERNMGFFQWTPFMHHKCSLTSEGRCIMMVFWSELWN